MPGGEAGPGRRDALIIASGQYQDRELGALRSPSRDAEELAEVLRDQAIGGFGVQVLLDEPGHLLREEIDGFFADRRPEDLLVLYLSCHGVKDVTGYLHFAASTTKLSRLASTGISAGFVYEQAERCRARKILLLLDCCYSGAYLKGHRPRAGNVAGIEPLEGQGRAVITSCTALEYAFEIDTGQVTATPAPSVFTAALVEGLRTGKADRDGDGRVSVDELYAYVYDRVRETTPHQTPEKKWAEARGEFIIARNPRPPARPPQSSSPATPAGTAGHARQPAATRRALLGLGTASAAGIAVAGWEFFRPKTTTPRTPPKTTPTPAPTTLWTLPSGIGSPATLAALTGDVVYANIGGPGGYLFALRASDGKKLWSSPRSKYLAAAPGGNIIYISDSKGIRAVRASDGRKIWQSPISISAGPVVAGRHLIVADIYGEVYALRASDGTRIWSFATSQGEPSGVAVAGSTVYTAGSNIGASVFALRAGKEIWKHPLNSVYNGPEAAGNIIYVTANIGFLHALRASDGTKLWTSPIRVESSFAPLITADGLYITGINDAFFALNASSGTRIWSFPARAEFGLLMARGAIYLANKRHAYALRASDGRKIWGFAADNGIEAIATAAQTIYVASNNLYALHASNGNRIWSFPVEANSVMAAAGGGAVYLGANNGEVYALHA